MSCLTKAVLALLIVSVWNIASPGVIITVPFPLSPPTVSLPLPFSINDVVISNLQLTKVELREVDYSWKLFAPRAEVNVSRAVVSFDWFYKKDSGKGFFIENELKLVFDWNFTTTKESRFQIAITSTKITPGLMKVELGGGVVETVVVEVTNLILNKASAIFRGIIANKLSSAITDASSIFGKDVQLYHDKTHNKNIKLNTTLVAAPIISNSTLLLQMNAAPYVQGQASGFLNPPDILVKAKSSKIQLQVHKLLFTRILELVLKVRGGLFVELESTSITSVIDIDSLALSPIFPQMGFYPINKDVVFSVAIPTVVFDFSGQHFQVKVRGQVTISTQGKTDKARTLYMSPINASASIELSLLFSEIGNSARLQKLEVIGFTPEKQDVDNVLIVPEALSKYFPQLMDWIKQAGNFELNRRLVRLQYQGIKVVLGGKVLNEHAYNIEVDLI